MTPRYTASDETTPAPGIVHNHFNTQSEAPQRQMPAWRDLLGYLVDVPISRAQIASGFAGTIDRYSVNDLVFLDCLTDSLTFGRPVARISTDSIRFFVFYVVTEGGDWDRGGLVQATACCAVHAIHDGGGHEPADSYATPTLPVSDFQLYREPGSGQTG